MNLIIDIGNTRTKLYVFEGKNLVEQTYCDNQTLDALDLLTKKYSFKKGIISSVGKTGNDAEQRLKHLPFEMTYLNELTALPIKLTYKPWASNKSQPMPSTMGADRIAALVGGISLFPGKPLLIIDAGTCVTYEIIDEYGDYRGGNIAPGLTMRLQSMHEHTALLPIVSTSGDTPDLGHDTETAMRSGATLGLTYEIEGYIRHWKKCYPELNVLITGGNDLTFNNELEPIIKREGNLVAFGLNAIIATSAK